MMPASICFPHDFLMTHLSPCFVWRRSINVSFIDWSTCASVMVFGNFRRTSFLSKWYNPHVLKPLFKFSGKFSEHDLAWSMNSLAKSSGKYSFNIFVATLDSFCQFWSPFATLLSLDRLQHIKNKGVRQSHTSSRNSEAIDMWKDACHPPSRCVVVCNDYSF